MVRMDIRCIPCILTVRTQEINKLVRNKERAFEIAKEIGKYLIREASSEANLTKLATYTFRMLKKLTKTTDPYYEEKERANNIAIKIANNLIDFLDNLEGYLRFEFLAKLATIGNALDLGVAGYMYNINDIVYEVKKINIFINDIRKMYLSLKKSNKVLYLLDNAGEAVFDKLFISEIRNIIKGNIVVVAKSDSFQNDITYEEALKLGLNDIAILIASGTDGSSIFLDEISEELKRELNSSDMIIAKGMAHYEYISFENKILKPTVFMLKAKCDVVASSLKVPTGSYVVKLEIPKFSMG